MGIVYQHAKDKGMITSYPDEPSAPITNMLVESGKQSVNLALAPLEKEEAEGIVLKLETMAMQKQNDLIATIVAEEMPNILNAARALKAKPGVGPYAGILGSGTNLEIMWLRAKDVGGSLLNPAGTASCGVHGQANGTESWTYSHTAGSDSDLIPEQTMETYAAVLHLGAIDPIEVCKLNACQFSLAGIPASPQPMEYRLRKGFGVDELPVVRFEKPIYVGPEVAQKVSVHPWTDGNDKTQLLSLLMSRVQALSL